MIPQIAEFSPKPRKLALRFNDWQGRVIARTLRLVLASYLCSEKLQFEISRV